MTDQHPSPGSSRTDPGSFRDPGSSVFYRDGGVYRYVDNRSLEHWHRLAETDFFAQQVSAGRIVETELVTGAEVPEGEKWAGILRHERIPVISYPYEWTFSMLREAALLQLGLLTAALQEGMMLKDSTPYNVQWRGHRPVFIDIGSFEILSEGDVWVGYRQFLSQYLYPLMLTARVGIPFQPWLRGQPDGLTAEQIRRVMPKRDLWRKSVLLHVVLPARGERSRRSGGRDVRTEFRDAGFTKEMIESNVNGLRGIVEKLEWRPGATRWNQYAIQCDHVAEQREAKAEFVSTVLNESAQRVVWDLGANDGHFSKLAAEKAEYVLALDGDSAVLDELFTSLAASGPDTVLPLVHDIADPSPGVGWRGRERPPLGDRSSPDLILCLAVIHHLVVGRNVPLVAVIEWLADFNARVVLEFVPLNDPMVLGLTANKQPHEIHADYNEAALRSYLSKRFVIEAESPLPGGERRLFALQPIVRT